MKTKKLFLTGAAMALSFALSTSPAGADCCGPPPATTRHVSHAPGWSGSVFFERMEMRTLLRGSEEIAPDQVLQERLNAGAARYSVPTSMLMDRAAIQLRYQFDENHSLRVSLPWRSNQMDMRMAHKHKMPAGGSGMGGHAAHGEGMAGAMNNGEGMAGAMTNGEGMAGAMTNGEGMAGAMNNGAAGMAGPAGMNAQAAHEHGHGHTVGAATTAQEAAMTHGGEHGMAHHPGGHAMAPMFMDHTMEPVDGLGDITLNYTYAFPVDEAQVYLGAGVSLPSGQWTVRDARGQLIHNMMQPGSGAPALMAEAGANVGLGESSFSLHPRVGMMWNATNPLGYQRGARLDYELGTRYQATPELDISLDLVGFVSAKDDTNGTLDNDGQVAFQRPETSLVDDVANTGGSFLFLTPGLRWQPTEDISLGFEYRLPLHQEVNGTQLGIDAWYRGYFTARF